MHFDCSDRIIDQSSRPVVFLQSMVTWMYFGGSRNIYRQSQPFKPQLETGRSQQLNLLARRMQGVRVYTQSIDSIRLKSDMT